MRGVSTSPMSPSAHAKPVELPDFADFVAGTDVLERIENINLFRFNVRYQASGALDNKLAITALQTDGYAVLNDLLERSGIHYLESLEAEVSHSDDSGDAPSSEGTAPIKFVFTHDMHHCEFAMLPDRFTIVRKSSSFEDFYNWYRLFMPHALGVETTLRKIVEDATSSTLRAVQSAFDFRINFADFHKPQVGRATSPAPDDAPPRMRNMAVLEEFIPSLPVNREKVSISQQQFYRLDLTLSKLQEFSGQRHRNTWYHVEAPFNENGRYIVFRAEMRNASSEVLDHDRGTVAETLAFDPNYGEDYYLALVEFLRDQALEGFLWKLFEHWNFDTERLL